MFSIFLLIIKDTVVAVRCVPKAFWLVSFIGRMG